MTKLLIINITLIIISIIFILLYKKAVSISIKRMLYEHYDNQPNDFRSTVNDCYAIYSFIFIFITILVIIANNNKASTIEYEIIFSMVAPSILIIGILSIISALLKVYNNHYCKDNVPKSLLSFILCVLSLKYYFLPKIFKDKFIECNDLISTRIDCTKVKKETSIKKLSIINKYLIPKLNKVFELINKNNKIKYENISEYNKRQDELINSKEEIIDKIDKLCDEIVSIENSADISYIDKDISEFKRSNIRGI